MPVPSVSSDAGDCTTARPDHRAGIASAVFNTARQVGSVIGVALFGALVAARAHFVPGFRLSVAIGGAALLTGGLLVAALGRHPRDSHPRDSHPRDSHPRDSGPREDRPQGVPSDQAASS
jgi:hypothetical protein